jgi:hypothetical protein
MQPLLPLSLALALLCAGCEQAAAPAAPAVAPPAAATAAPPAAAPAAPPSAAASAPSTADVAEFRAQRDQCDHFRGEDPYDAKRAAELATQLDKFCKGTDARLAGLRKKYAVQPAVLESLKDYEDQVE